MCTIAEIFRPDGAIFLPQDGSTFIHVYYTASYAERSDISQNGALLLFKVV